MPYKNANDKARNLQTRYRRAVAAGRCVGCLKTVPPPGQRRCPPCAEVHAARAHQRKGRLRGEGRCVRCLAPSRSGRNTCAPCAERQTVSNRARRNEQRALVFANYGGARCACCGETELEFLSIDHVMNDGAEHRKRVIAASLLGWLIRNRFPAGFQVLCMNCNFAKGKLGYCPHARGRT